MNASLESLGWTLLHFCWQAAAIMLIYWAVDLALPRASSQTRYLMSLATLLSMLAAAVATLVYETARNHAGLPLSLSVGGANASGLPPGLAAFAGGGAVQGAGKQPAGLDLSAMLPWLDAAWLLGVLCLSARTIGGWWWIERLRRQALIEAPARVRASFSRVRERLGVRQRVDLRISERVASPIAIGIVRSLILLPASALLALSPEQLEAVLAHELAHVRRADYFWNLMQTMVETLFFFHPAVWWLGKRLREQRELCCDDAAVAACSDPLLYATALLSMEEQRSRRLDLAMAFGGRQSRSSLRARIARVLGEGSFEMGKAGFASLPLAAICVGLVIFLLPAAQVFGGLRVKTLETEAQLRASDTTAPAPDAYSVKIGRSSEPSADVVSARTKAAEDAVRSQDLTRKSAERARVSDSQDRAARPPIAPIPPPALSPRLPLSSVPLDYIEQMKAAGYDVDPGKYIGMKILGVTPEYARAMQKAGFGKPSVNDLIALKVQGITPEYLAKLHSQGVTLPSFRDVIAYRMFKVTPEFVAAMKAAGFPSLRPQDMAPLRVEGITPEYAAAMKKQFPGVTVEELIQLRAFKIDDAFIAEAKRHNFSPLTVQKLMRLRISGLLDDIPAGSDKK